MGRSMSFRDLMNAIKDKASQSKAAIKISTSKSHSSLHLSLLRATTHDHSSPPDPKHIATLLSFGHGSRATASAAIESLMDRLQTTRDSSVAVKCLVVVHSIIKQGSFILQDQVDKNYNLIPVEIRHLQSYPYLEWVFTILTLSIQTQLSVYPASGGRNYLKLSDFRDGSNPASWELSIWVRWYARYLEQLLYASRVLGFFLCSASSAPEKEKAEERVSAMVNSDLVKETDSLVGLIEEIGKLPESLQLEGNILIGEIRDLVSDDFLSAINDVSVRVEEFKHRVGCLSFGESVELVCVLKRLERCRERLGESWTRKRVLIEGLWSAAREVLDAAAAAAEEEEEKCGGGGRLLLTWRRKEQGSESDRFGSRVLSFSDSFKGSSVRFGSNRYS